jgi:hypothetical protein
MTTISAAYRKQQELLHRNPKYGSASLEYAPLVRDILRATGYRSLCDYGAGKCRLGGELRGWIKDLDYHPYDPAFPDYGPAVPAQVVTCIDVLEHIEPELLDNVIAELVALTQSVGFFTVHCGPAQKVLADGRNAHLSSRCRGGSTGCCPTSISSSSAPSRTAFGSWCRRRAGPTIRITSCASATATLGSVGCAD